MRLNWLRAKNPLILEKPVAMAIQMFIWRVLLPALPASLGGLPDRFKEVCLGCVDVFLHICLRQLEGEMVE